MTLQIKPAVRENTYSLIALWGESGAGKTYSALKIARGIVGEDGKIGFIDTENKRSHFYADVVTKFDVIDLNPPFAPARYLEALSEFEQAGYKVVVIDSMSHEWEGVGGCREMADETEMRTGKTGLFIWKKPKQEHAKLMNRLLQANMHIIFCLRAREKMKQVKIDGKTQIVSQGVLPIAEKNFIFEMTVSLALDPRKPGVANIVKCPEDLRDAFPDAPITERTGAALAAWASMGSPVDDVLTALSAEGRDAAMHGSDMLKVWWQRITKDKKAGGSTPAQYKALSSLKDDELKAIAANADIELAQHEELSDA